MKVALMVAEKPSAAETIAKKLCQDRNLKSRKALNGVPVHEWPGTFRNTPVLFRMTAVTGHVFGLDFPAKYNSWDKVDPADLFECGTIKTEANEKQRTPIMLKSEAKGASFLILWLDCDKEGENICFEVMDILLDNMTLIPGQNVFRARFSALTYIELSQAMSNLTVPNVNESKSVDARQELDLRIGCSFTRFQTKIFHGKYGGLDSALMSYGPCQTPTLGFCVMRHDAIQQFKPEKFWTINLTILLEEGKEMKLDWKRKRLFDKESAEHFLSSIRDYKHITLNRIERKERTKPRPVGLNTVELMRLASSHLGMSPQHTMHIAERLYVQGYISYPRTETTQYPNTFDYRNEINKFGRHEAWSNYVDWDLLVTPRKGIDCGDHSPITPQSPVNPSIFNDYDASKLYSFIVKYFLSTFTQDCIYLESTLDFSVGKEMFSLSGKEIIEPGFTKIFPLSVISSSQQIPQMVPDTQFPIVEKKLFESETKPPDYLTEAELISLMEKHGIGTDASIPVHINNICVRNYVQLVSGRKLQPTDLGVILVHGYLKIDPELVLPTMRASIEKQLDLIAKGEAALGPVVDHTLDIFKAKFLYFVSNITYMDELFEVSFSKHAESGKPFSRCGKCRRYMKLVAGKTSRLHCQNCNETYSVPQNGALRPFNNNRCPLDDFEIIEWNGGSKAKSYTFCPYCINDPPFPEMRKGQGCNSCLHPGCSYGINMRAICACEECDDGLLVLDPASGPKWKLSCNGCEVYISVFEGSRKVIVCEEEKCQYCDTRLLCSELPKKSTDEMKGCIFCTQEFEPYVEKHRVLGKIGGKRGRGRSRGRRGRRSRGSSRRAR